MWGEITRTARTQDGLITLDQLRVLGVGDGGRRHLLDNDRLETVAPGVYAIAGSPRTHRRDLRTGLLALGPDSAIAFEAAAALHGLDRSDESAVEFLVPRHRRGHRLDFVVHSSAFIGRLDVVSVEGLRCTSATRTILDLALARRHPQRIEAAIDSAIRQGLSSPKALVCRLESLRGRGRWGVRLLDRLLIDSGGHSPLERRFLQLVRGEGLPRPVTQAVFHRNGRHVARVDFLFEAERVVVEVSGGRGHSSPRDRAKDAQRRNELQDLGFRVYEFTWEQVTQRPRWVRARLRAYLAGASGSSPSSPGQQL